MAAGAGAGAAAAAAAAQRLREEEEEMTAYSSRDLADDWEFKIVRSAMSTFRNPEKLRAMLEEEARAGWVLVEKFDDQRIRLKRPAHAKQLDGKLDFDPYRTQVGTTDAKAALVILGIIGGVLLTVVLLAIAVKR
jgi:hypothetical protein